MNPTMSVRRSIKYGPISLEVVALMKQKVCCLHGSKLSDPESSKYVYLINENLVGQSRIKRSR